MKTTLNKIREHHPCANGWAKLLRYLGKTNADDEPLDLLTVLESNDLDDALWCLRAVDGYDREKRLYAVWRARQVEHLSDDPRVKACNDVSERYANGLATYEELAAARNGAWAAAWAAARNGAWASMVVASAALWAAGDAAVAAGDAAVAARDAAVAARDAAVAGQKAEFIRMIKEGYK